MSPPWRIDPTTHRTMSECSYYSEEKVRDRKKARVSEREIEKACVRKRDDQEGEEEKDGGGKKKSFPYRYGS